MRLLSLVVVLFISICSYGQSDWKLISEEDVQFKNLKEREITPNKLQTFTLDFKSFTNKLIDAVHEDQRKASKGKIITLPMPNGELVEFQAFSGTAMHPELAEKFPNIRTFRAYGPQNTIYQALMDFGPLGFHAVVKTPEGTVYIDPYFKEADEYYMSYYIKDDIPEYSQLKNSCGVSAHDEIQASEKRQHFQFRKKVKSDPVIKRKYRLAMATTGEWGARYNSVDEVMAAVVSGVVRLNMVFENEVAATFELIPENDEILFMDGATDPYDNPNLGGELVGVNSFVLNSTVGSGAYDIGHVITIRCTDGVAGIAALGAVCLNNKGNGVSCVGNSNIESFFVRTTAHELGHQFSGGHSWNNCPAASDQLSPGTAYEPGSGSTILSYGGICGSQNIQNTRDGYFHVGNVEQFQIFMETTGNCAEREDSGNHTPDVEVPFGNGLTIPIATPFELEGSATDIDGDVLTYNWEQVDLGPVSPLGNPSGNAPSFRSYPPSTNPYRMFPRLPFVLGGIGSNLEVLPLYSRNLTFRFTVKDNHPGAGTTVWEEIQFRSTDSAGPFRVTSPNTLTFVEVGDELEIEWDVANTDNEEVDCQFVDIYFSTDNGDNFDILLLDDVPNNGSATITIPNILTNEGKIKVKASNNIFFQFNRSNIVIREQAEPGFFIDVDQTELDICLPDVVEIDVIGTSFQAFEEPVNLELNNVPEGVEFEFIQNPILPAGQTKLIMDFTNVTVSDNFQVELMASATGADTLMQNISFNLTGTNFDDLELLDPVSGSDGLAKTPEFIWTDAINADTYTLEISNSPEFGSTNVITEAFYPDTSFVPTIVFDDSQLFYWRVLATNNCIETPSEINTFGTPSLNCLDFTAEDLPKNITFSGSVEVDGTVQVFDVGTVADVNITKIRGQHPDVLQLTGHLTSPSGTRVTLFDRNCFASTDLNIGFDSDSPLDFMCPLSSGLVVKPLEEDLSVFNGESIQGDWVFTIEDNVPGDGGQFTSFDLELCASISVSNPELINNNVLDVPTGLSARIFQDKLLVTDADNSADELIYTLVVDTENGQLFFNGEPMTVGSQFSQSDLTNGSIRYVHEGTENETDQFVFTVIDGEGGWLDLTTFNININEDVISSTETLDASAAFDIFPNPTNNILNIRDIGRQNNTWNIQLIGINGQRILNERFSQSTRLDLGHLEIGLYILQLSSDSRIYTEKINLIK